MDINVLETSKHRIVFELQGADHTICNALKNELWNDDNVTVSAYNISHPLIGVPKFIVETKGDPKAALADASKRLQKKNKAFLSSL